MFIKVYFFLLINVRRQTSWCAIDMVDEPTYWGGRGDWHDTEVSNTAQNIALHLKFLGLLDETISTQIGKETLFFYWAQYLTTVTIKCSSNDFSELVILEDWHDLLSESRFGMLIKQCDISCFFLFIIVFWIIEDLGMSPNWCKLYGQIFFRLDFFSFFLFLLLSKDTELYLCPIKCT